MEHLHRHLADELLRERVRRAREARAASGPRRASQRSLVLASLIARPDRGELRARGEA